MRATVFASSLAAVLELAREGAMEVHQAAAFAPIYMRKRAAARQAAAPPMPGGDVTSLGVRGSGEGRLSDLHDGVQSGRGGRTY